MIPIPNGLYARWIFIKERFNRVKDGSGEVDHIWPCYLVTIME